MGPSCEWLENPPAELMIYLMKITDVSTNQNSRVMGLFIWKSRTAPLPFSLCLIENIMATCGWAARLEVRNTTNLHALIFTAPRFCSARWWESIYRDRQSVTQNSKMIKDRNQLEHPKLYSHRYSKWVSGTTIDHFVQPDWPQLQGSERLSGPSVRCFWLCLCGGGCARTVFRF